MIYCDGATHLRTRDEPISYKGKNLYFRGTNNTMEHFRYLNQTYDMQDLDKVVITGGSAGGVGVFFWTQYLQDHTKSAKIYSIPDSGLFLLDYESPITKQKIVKIQTSNLLTLIGNSSQSYPEPVKKCYNHIHDLVLCLDASNFAEYITAPMFLVQSSYDEWSIANLLAVHCATNKSPPFSLDSCNDTEMSAISDYHK